MATAGKQTLLLGMVTAALVAAAACASAGFEPPGSPDKASVTISNPERIIFSVELGDNTVTVTTDTMIITLDYDEQDIAIVSEDGQVTTLHVQNGDVVMMDADPEDPRKLTAQILGSPYPPKPTNSKAVPPMAMTRP